jgi:hypothetical protein
MLLRYGADWQQLGCDFGQGEVRKAFENHAKAVQDTGLSAALL